MGKFCHLHNHTIFSILDGVAKLEDIAKLVASYGMPAFALTDHGNMASAIKWYKLGKQYNFNAIVGQEMYLVDNLEGVGYREDKIRPYHLTMLAATYEGYKNLVRLNNLGHRQFYYRPLITKQQLEEMPTDGLICLSGCSSGELAVAYKDGKSISDVMNWYRDVFGENYYLELMKHDYPEETEFSKFETDYFECLARMVTENKIPFVITNDCHYVTAEAEQYHQKLLNLSKQNGGKYRGVEFDGSGFYIKSEDEMKAMFDGALWQIGLYYNQEIVEKCKGFSIPTVDKRVWHIPQIMSDEEVEETIIAACKEALVGKSDEYLDRAAYEFQIFKDAGMLSYFVVPKEYIDFATSNNIVHGVGRGSITGILIANLMGITGVDPIQHNLSLERAFNRLRPSIPDFDIDFSSARRTEVIDHLIERYGDNAIQIGTYGHIGLKGAVRAVGRGLNLDYMLMDSTAKAFPDGVDDWVWGIHEQFLSEDVLKKLPVDFWGMVKTIIGTISHSSKHAAGVVISDDRRLLLDEVPIIYIASSKSFTSQYDMDDMKDLGFVKFDILGISAIDIIERTVELIGFDPLENMDDLNDNKVFQLINSGRMLKVFQLEGNSHKHVINALGGVESFEDIVATLALGRPGALMFVDEYVVNRAAKELTYIHPALENILGVTYNVPLYQEQIMNMSKVIAGFDDIDADVLKQAISHQDSEEFELLAEKFHDNCIERGIDEDTTKQLWYLIEKNGGYLFNRNHAVSYSLIAYRMAWLKTYYPMEFYAAIWDSVKEDERFELWLECLTAGIQIIPPCVIKSEFKTTIQDDKIVLGLGVVKGIADKSWQKIKENPTKNQQSKFKGSGIFRYVEAYTPTMAEQMQWIGAPVYSSFDPEIIKPYINNGWNGGGMLISIKERVTKAKGNPIFFLNLITENVELQEYVSFDESVKELKVGEYVVVSAQSGENGRSPLATRIGRVQTSP